ncbi:MAG: hypothetical protein K0Q55_2056 [Verrucomicrobia bacterium]|nr:hypothetical protein [Verrucomicrobiota bacterium]
MSDDIGFAAGLFHFVEGPEFFGIGFQSCLHLGPFEAFVAVLVFLEARFQGVEQFFALLGCQLLFGSSVFHVRFLSLNYK